ncbi:MAG: hypothetical protein ACR2P0_00840 [Acidimicrobiales bacterium]
MDDTVLLVTGKTFRRISVEEWKRELEGAPAAIASRLAFMDENHHRVRNHLVRQLPYEGAAGLSPQATAAATDLPVDRVQSILEELERNLFFLVRDPSGRGAQNVTWAFPVTVERTPHHVAFSTGENTYAA